MTSVIFPQAGPLIASLFTSLPFNVATSFGVLSIIVQFVPLTSAHPARLSVFLGEGLPP